MGFYLPIFLAAYPCGPLIGILKHSRIWLRFRGYVPVIRIRIRKINSNSYGSGFGGCMYVMYNLLPYLIRRSTAPHLLPPLEDDYSPDLDPNHNIEEVSPSEGGTSVYSMLRPVCFGPAFILCRSGFLTIYGSRS